jgi:hypothetical protein
MFHIFEPVGNITAWLVTQEELDDPTDLVSWLLGQLAEGYTIEPGGMGGLTVRPPQGDPAPVTCVYGNYYTWVQDGRTKARPQDEFESYYTLQ